MDNNDSGKLNSRYVEVFNKWASKIKGDATKSGIVAALRVVKSIYDDKGKPDADIIADIKKFVENTIAPMTTEEQKTGE